LPDQVFQSGSALTPRQLAQQAEQLRHQIPGQPALNSPRFNPTGLDKAIVPPAAPNTISRKRGVFHATLNRAVELGLLPANRIHNIQWRAPTTAAAIHPATVASAAHLRASSTTEAPGTRDSHCSKMSAHLPVVQTSQ
jgi:hypothetical protein